ncbi:MAG: hypothetical protein JWQ75_1020 [Pseudarthrobacter sp.]|nr:hypothetical protein [Pseudarthrobacter sp.]
MHSQTAAGARSAAAAAALCLLVLASGCFAAPSSPDVRESTTAAPTTAGPSPSPPPELPTVRPLPGPVVGPAIPDAPVIRWVPLGPAAPTDPPEGTLYEQLRNRDCAGLLESTLNTSFPAVWAAAGATCVALASDNPGDWQRAGELLAIIPGLPPERCWEIKVRDSLRQAIVVRAGHPGVQLRLDAQAGDDCRRQLTGLTVLDGPHAGGSPPTVPAGGGTPVRLEGFFVNVDSVLVGGTFVDFEGPQFGPFVFYSPEGAAGTAAKVTVQATPAVSGEAVLQFAGPPAAGPTPSTPSIPGPTPSGTEPPAPGPAPSDAVQP